MAIFTLTINAQTPAFGGGRRSGERQQIVEAMRAVTEAVRNPGQLSGPITDINRAPGTAIAVIGNWTYTPVASGGE